MVRLSGALQRVPQRAGLAAGRRAVVLRETYDVTLELPDGETATFPCADDEFIIDAAEEHGIELPASCRSGAAPASAPTGGSEERAEEKRIPMH